MNNTKILANPSDIAHPSDEGFQFSRLKSVKNKYNLNLIPKISFLWKRYLSINDIAIILNERKEIIKHIISNDRNNGGKYGLGNKLNFPNREKVQNNKTPTVIKRIKRLMIISEMWNNNVSIKDISFLHNISISGLQKIICKNRNLFPYRFAPKIVK